MIAGGCAYLHEKQGELIFRPATQEQAEGRVQAKIDSLNKEAAATVAAMEKQVAEAQANAKEKIRQRIATMRAEYGARSAKLKQAWALTKEALAA